LQRFLGLDLREGANWAIAQGPPQLRSLHTKNSKNYYLRKHKKILFETDNLE